MAPNDMAPNDSSLPDYPQVDGLPPAAMAWFSPRQIVSHQPITGGLSGGRVWRIDLKDQTHWALRMWPPGTNIARIQEIHQNLKFLSKEGCSVIPEYRAPSPGGNHWLAHEHQFWDCANWISGDSLETKLSVEQVAKELALGAALFSERACKLTVSGEQVPAITERITRIGKLQCLVRDHGSKLLELAKSHPWSFENTILVDGVRKFLGHWHNQSPSMLQTLRRHAAKEWPVTWVIRDCHPGNAIFRQRKLVAWIDFDACRIDTPAVDIGRILSCLDAESASTTTPYQGDAVHQSDIMETATTAYRSIASLSEREVGLIQDFRWINPLITLGNWLNWSLLESRKFDLSATDILARIRGWATAFVQR